MFCHLTNEICETPVVSKKTGHIYEKAALEKYLKNNANLCPITNEPMSKDDYVEIKNFQMASRPKPPTHTSIPALLKSFQNEWDQVMLESYNLKKHCEEIRQQLSHALYQYDAACRVIARLTQERDRAMNELANTRENMAAALTQSQVTMESMIRQQNINNNVMNDKQNSLNEQRSTGAQEIEMSNENNSNNNEKNIENKNKSNNADNVQHPKKIIEATTFSQEIIDYIVEYGLNLSQHRKDNNKQAKKLAQSTENISQYQCVESYNAHSPSEPGISCMDLHPTKQQYVITGGNDATLIIYNRETKKFEHVLKGHTRKITDVKFHHNENIILSSSSDNQSFVWNYSQNDEEWQIAYKQENHTDVITGLCIHPLGTYYAVSSLDCKWSLYNMYNGATLLSIENENKKGYSCIDFHPDGQILGLCSEDFVKIYDMRQKNIGATFDGHKDIINCITFNENGYYVATGDESGLCKIWDLRKIGKNVTSLSTDAFNGKRIKVVTFDKSGSYLAIGQPNGFEVYECKTSAKIASFYDHSKDVSGVRFGEHANFIVSASKDRKVNFYQL